MHGASTQVNDFLIGHDSANAVAECDQEGVVVACTLLIGGIVEGRAGTRVEG